MNKKELERLKYLYHATSVTDAEWRELKRLLHTYYLYAQARIQGLEIELDEVCFIPHWSRNHNEV